MKRNFQNFITIFAIFLIAGGLFVFGSVEKVESGAGHNVSGWAWSDNIGWICFNNTTDGSGIDYGVNIKNDGELEGYAWSDNAGWITFNKGELGGCPQGTCKAKLDKDTGRVFGWAKVISSNNWIRLRDETNGYAGDDVYVDTATGDFHNFAWSEGSASGDADDIGWISFNSEGSGPNYKVTTSFAFAEPVTVDITANGSDGPLTIAHNAEATLVWTSENADSCVASGAWSGSKNLNDSEPTGSLIGPQTYTYTIKCENSVYDYTDSVEVVVEAIAGIVTISASPTDISDGEFSILTWLLQDIDLPTCSATCVSQGGGDCDINGDWVSIDFSVEGANGNYTTDNLVGPDTYTYTITCTDLNSVDRNASVDVNVSFALPLPEWWEISPAF